MSSEMKSLKNDVVTIKEEMTLFNQGIDSGRAQEDGQKCRDNNKATLQECYEFIYEPIKSEKKANAGCQCTIF